MELNIDISPEQINKLVSEAVLQSAIGEAVRTQIDNQITELSKPYDNAIAQVIKENIRQSIIQCLRQEYGDILKEKVKDALSKKLTDDFVFNIIESGLQ